MMLILFQIPLISWNILTQRYDITAVSNNLWSKNYRWTNLCFSLLPIVILGRKCWILKMKLTMYWVHIFVTIHSTTTLDTIDVSVCCVWSIYFITYNCVLLLGPRLRDLVPWGLKWTIDLVMRSTREWVIVSIVMDAPYSMLDGLCLNTRIIHWVVFVHSCMCAVVWETSSLRLFHLLMFRTQQLFDKVSMIWWQSE